MPNYMPSAAQPHPSNDWGSSASGISNWIKTSDDLGQFAAFDSNGGGYINRVLSEFNPGVAVPTGTRYTLGPVVIKRISGTGSLSGLYIGVWNSGQFRYASIPLYGMRTILGQWVVIPNISPIVNAGNNFNGSGSSEAAIQVILYTGAGTARWGVKGFTVYNNADALPDADLEVADANFSATPSSTSLSASFSSTNANDLMTEFRWQWGDGSPDTYNYAEDIKTVSHTFPTAGTYTVTLRAANLKSPDNGVAPTENNVTSQAKTVVVPSGTYTANFVVSGSYRDVDVDAGSSVGAKIDTYRWQWGDGSADSFGKTASHIYSSDGVYNITLTISNSLGQTSSKIKQYSATGIPTAAVNFTAVRDFLDVDFVSIVQTGGGTYSWNFGDGSPASTAANPSHTYPSAGTYTVTLTYTLSGTPTSIAKEITVNETYTTLDRVIEYLRLEIELPPAANTAFNLIKNPNGEQGGYFWNTPAPTAALIGTNTADPTKPGGAVEGWKMVYTAIGNGSAVQYLNSNSVRANPGEAFRGAFSIPQMGGSTSYYRAWVSFYSISGVFVSDGPITGYLQANAGSQRTAIAVAPAGAYYAKMVFAFYANASGLAPTGACLAVVRRVMLAKAVTETITPNPNFETGIESWDAFHPVIDKVWNAPLQRLRVINKKGQLLANSTFDVNANNWTAGTATTIARTTTAPQAGAGALAVTKITAIGTAFVSSTNTPVTAGQAFNFRVYVKTAVTARSCTLKIEWYNAANGLISTTTGTASNDTTSWVLRTLTDTAPALAVNARVRVEWASAAVSEVHYIDTAMLVYNDNIQAINNELVPVVPGEILTGTAKSYASSTTLPFLLRVVYYDSAKVFLSNTDYAPGTSDSIGGVTITNNFTVPGGAVYAQFRVGYDYAMVNGEIHDIDDAGLSGYPRWFQFLAYQESENWLDILDSSFEIHIAREELSLGELDVSILDTELDPATKDILRPGRAVRLRAQTEDPLGNVQYESLFVGDIANAEVSYLRQNNVWIDEIGQDEIILRKNWLYNPSFENNTSAWSGNTVFGARDLPTAFVISNTRASQGSFSGKISVPATTKGVVVVQLIEKVPRSIDSFTVSLDVWVPAGVSTGGIRLSALFYTSGAPLTTFGSWEKLYYTIDPSILPDDGGNVGHFFVGVEVLAPVPVAFDMWIDGGLAEASASVGGYFDGYTPGDGINSYKWYDTVGGVVPAPVDSQSVQYIPEIPFVPGHYEAVPEQRSAQIEMVAYDVLTKLTQQPETRGVRLIPDLAFLMEGKDAPYQINGSTAQVASAGQVSSNDSASIVDQVAITRDENHGYAYVNRNGVLVINDSVSMPSTVVRVLDEDDYTGIDVNFNPDNCINEVQITYLRYNATTGDTEEVSYGPYRDQTSVDEWGLHSKPFTVQGMTESSGNFQTFANEIFATSSDPQVRVNSLRFPIIYAEDLTDGKALADLYDLLEVKYAGKDIDHEVRVTRIEHEITLDHWDVALGFSPEGAVASPQVTPQIKNTVPTWVEGVWTTFSGNVPNVPKNNLYCKYFRVGNTVRVHQVIQLTGAVLSSALIDVPFPFSSDAVIHAVNKIGSVRGIRTGTAWYQGDVCVQQLAGPSRANILLPTLAGNAWGPTNPATWAAGDMWTIDYEYEAAP